MALMLSVELAILDLLLLFLHRFFIYLFLSEIIIIYIDELSLELQLRLIITIFSFCLKRIDEYSQSDDKSYTISFFFLNETDGSVDT